MTASAPPVSDPAPPRGGWRLPLVVGVVGFLIVAVVAWIALSASDESSQGASDVTDPVRFDLPALEGTGRVRLADFNGTPLVVNFFASWCEPCKKELPDFADAARKLAGKVAFVAVNSKELSPPSGVALARSNGLADAGITLARDVGGGGSGLHDAYQVRQAMPISAFYDAGGELVHVAVGQLTAGKLAEQLQRLFGVTL